MPPFVSFRGRAQRPIPYVPCIPWFFPTEESRFKEGNWKQREQHREQLESERLATYPLFLLLSLLQDAAARITYRKCLR